MDTWWLMKSNFFLMTSFLLLMRPLSDSAFMVTCMLSVDGSLYTLAIRSTSRSRNLRCEKYHDTKGKNVGEDGQKR